MPVLRDGTGQQHRERYRAGGEQGDKQQMRPRFGDDAYQDGQQNHPRDVLTNQFLKVEIVQPDLDDKQCAKGPKEYAQEVFADDVLPKVFLDDVFVRCGDELHHKEADDGEDEVHPVLVEDIELSMRGCFVLVLEHTESQGHDEQDYTQKQCDTLCTGVTHVA